MGFIIIAIGLHCGPACAELPTSAQMACERPLVGVNYFAGWWKELPNKWHGQGWNADQPDWRPEFPDRVPLLGQYNDQATMDREIVAAAGHGVDFFAILWYYPKRGSRQEKYAPLLNKGLETYLASDNAERMRFFIEYCNSPDFSASGEEEWAACVATWLEAMKHPAYLRVDGRLVFKVHGVTQFLRANDNDLDLCRQRLDTLRDAVRNAGLGEMIIGVGISGQTPPLGAKWPPAELFDFTGTYMCVPEIEGREADYPYAVLSKQAHTTLRNRVSDPLPWMPYLAAGWNPRPWTHAGAAPHYHRFFEFPTREEFENELNEMKESLRECIEDLSINQKELKLKQNEINELEEKRSKISERKTPKKKKYVQKSLFEPISNKEQITEILHFIKEIDINSDIPAKLKEQLRELTNKLEKLS